MTDLLPIWKADLNALLQTQGNLSASHAKDIALLTTYVNQFNAGASHAALAATLTQFILAYSSTSPLLAQLGPQLSKLASDMAPTLAVLTDAQRQALLANRAQYLGNAYLLIVNLCLQYTQADALTEAQLIYNALVADINNAWANKNGTAPKPTPIPSVVFDTSNALNVYVGPDVPPSIGGPAPFVPQVHK